MVLIEFVDRGNLAQALESEINRETRVSLRYIPVGYIILNEN